MLPQDRGPTRALLCVRDDLDRPGKDRPQKIQEYRNGELLGRSAMDRSVLLPPSDTLYEGEESDRVSSEDMSINTIIPPESAEFLKRPGIRIICESSDLLRRSGPQSNPGEFAL